MTGIKGRIRGRIGYWRLRRFEIRNALAVRLFGAAPDEERCVMGSPVSRDAWCRHAAVDHELWCKKHAP